MLRIDFWFADFIAYISAQNSAFKYVIYYYDILIYRYTYIVPTESLFVVAKMEVLRYQLTLDRVLLATTANAVKQ